MTDEEARAAAYRDTLTQRVRNTAARAKALAGSPTALATLRDNWQPIRLWLAERKATAQPEQDAGC